MNTNDLLIFQTAYLSASFNQAADKLYMSAQGLTKSITKLEKELGVTLFERTKKGITPTVYGDALYRRTGELDAILKDIASIKTINGGKKVVSLYSTYGVLSRLGYTFFEEFQNTQKDIILNLIEFPDSALAHNFRMDRANLGFVTNPAEFDHYKSTYAFTQKVCAVVCSAHPLASKRVLSPQDIAKFPLAIRGKEYNIFEKNSNNFLRQDLQTNIVLETSQDSFILDFAKRNRGIGILLDFAPHGSLYRHLLDSRELIQIPISDDNFSTDVFLIESITTPLSEEESALKRYILNRISSYRQ